MPFTAKISRRLTDQRGYTLPELLVSLLIGLAVVGTGVKMVTAGVQAEPRAADRAARIQEARVMTERLTRELRQGSDATTPNPSRLTVLTFVRHATCGSTTPAADTATAIRCRIFYDCNSAGTCTRTECPWTVASTATPTSPPCGTPVQILEGLMSNQVFSFTPRAPGHSYVALALAFPAEHGDDAITIQGGAALRNPPLGAS